MFNKKEYLLKEKLLTPKEIIIELSIEQEIVLASKLAFDGNFEVLSYKKVWNSGICYNAAKKGHFELLVQLNKRGCPWDNWVCTFAAKRGDFKMLKYAHENGCPWNSMVCIHAAYRNDLDMLKYALNCGCPYSEEVRYYVKNYNEKVNSNEAKSSHRAMFQFVLDYENRNREKIENTFHVDHGTYLLPRY